MAERGVARVDASGGSSHADAADALSRTSAALRYLRSRTLGRAVKSYVEWIGRALGWWTLVYLAFWAVVYVIAGVETLVRLDSPLSLDFVRWLAVVGAVLFVGLALTGRAPPVSLDRRDLYRLALGPAREPQLLRLRLNTRRALRAAFGAAVGGVWTLVAPFYFHVVTPWAAPALALLAVAYGEAAWSRYARREGPVPGRDGDVDGGLGGLDVSVLLAAAIAAFAFSASGVPALARFGALAALTGPDASALLVPVALALAALVVTRRTLTVGWPRRFLAQSLVLTQLQAMRTFQLLAGAAGVPRAREGDAGERQRLLAALHDKPGAVRPRRSLPLPPADAQQRRAFAWRTATALYRRPRVAQLRLLLGTLTAAVAVLASGAQVALLTAPPPAPGVAAAVAGGSAANGFAVALGVLLGAAWLAVVAGAALGPSVPRSSLPVLPGARTAGRLLPFAVLLFAAFLPAALLLAALPAWLGAAGAGLALLPAGLSAGQVVMAVVATCLCCCLTLEKYSSWTGSPPGAWECVLVAALLTAMPAMVAVALGVAGWALTAQLIVTAIVYLINI